MQALVYKSTGSWYRIRRESGEFADARLRGRLKTEDIHFTNPIAVGDRVIVSEDDNGDVMIEDIVERENYIIRESPQNKNTRHIIAANLSQSILMASLRDPVTSTGFIDRFLVVCEAFHIPAILLFNKYDIYWDKEKKKFETIRQIYSTIGYPVLLTSLETGYGMDSFPDLLKEKHTLISGHSGVGKSSFINKLIPDYHIKVRSVSGWSGKGVHTTTYAEMHDLPFGGSIIDTPGIRELAITDIEPVELSHYFKEMTPLIGQCRFNNCLHREEPKCAIKAAVSDELITEVRYFSYLNILDSMV